MTGKESVLRPAKISSAGEQLRKRFDRRNLLTAVLYALAAYTLLFGVLWLFDRLRIRDLGEWSGPVLVKIGSPEAPESSQPDPGPLPEDIPETLEPTDPVQEPVQPIQPPAEPVLDSSPEGTLPEIPRESPQPIPETRETVDSSVPSREATPRPARVQGSEDGNNYFINFEGTEEEIGRAGAYEYITSYMPLPEVLDAAMVASAQRYLSMSPSFVREELERYWELSFDDYVKKRGSAGNVPLQDRPYYWSLLVNSLGYDTKKADWRSAGMRPVVVEFLVQPSAGARGAELTDFRMVSRTNNPKVDEAVVYGLSRWVYYNDTDHSIRGTITYEFDR